MWNQFLHILHDRTSIEEEVLFNHYCLLTCIYM